MTTRRETMRTIKTMFTIGFRAHRRLMILSLALLVASGASLAGPSLGFRLLTDGFLDDDTPRVVVAVLIVSAVSTFMWMAGILGATTSGALSEHVRLYISARLAELAHAVPGIEHFERPEYLMQLEQLELNRNLIGAGPQQLVYMVQSLAQVSATSVLLATVHPLLLLLPGLGVFPIIAQSRSVRMRQRTEEALADDRRLTDELFGLAATASTAKELRVFGFTDELRRRHRAVGDHVAREATAAAVRGATSSAIGWVLFATGLFSGVLLVIREAAHGRATPGEALMAVGLAQLTQMQLMNVSNTVGQVLTTARSVKRYMWLEQYAVDASPIRTGQARAVPDRLHDGITLDHVTFRYPGTDIDVVRDLTLDIPAGATVALVGENGAGKTTLVKLLSGMYTPTSGRILVDGVPLTDFDIVEWREQMSAAFQDFVKFELAARDVVGVGDLAATNDDDVVLEALERAGAADVVETLDRGLDTTLGRSFKGGRDLSGGQWQKLALGRAMMRPTPLLLVLDEPTSSLDAHTEGALFDRYERAARRARNVTGAVTILVSHRFSTVRMADLIVVLEDGRISAAGTHRALMAERGLYAELYDLQAQPYR